MKQRSAAEMPWAKNHVLQMKEKMFDTNLSRCYVTVLFQLKKKNIFFTLILNHIGICIFNNIVQPKLKVIRN